MQLLTSIIDQDVIKIHHNKFAKKLSQNMVH